MIELSLAAVQACIMAAFGRYLVGAAGAFEVETQDGARVEVNCAIDFANTRFNCGIPGYYMADNQVDALRRWCIDHPGGGWSFGFRGHDPDHQQTVNVTLIDRTPLMFNFHVNTG